MNHNFKMLKLSKFQHHRSKLIQSIIIENPKLEYKHKDHKITMQEVIEGKFTIEEMVEHLIVNVMASMAVGKVSAEIESTVGQACALVPGAAGETWCY